MHLGVVGINHKLADLKLREQLAKACQKLFGKFNTVVHDHYFVLLSTCNRTEVYFSSEDLASTHSYIFSLLRSEVEEEFDHKLYSYFGVDCFYHLTRVTAGLDSAILGETEIQGQVKAAYEGAVEYLALPKELHFLFQKSLGIAKKIRSDFALGRGMPNLEDAIYQTGQHLFHQPEQANLLFVGASEINQKILSSFKMKGFQNMTICNRSETQSAQLVELLGIRQLPWERLNEWKSFDWIVLGTKSPDYLVKKEPALNYIEEQKLVIDLSVPRNVEPAVGQYRNITLLNIDEINRMLQIRCRKMTEGLVGVERKISEAIQYHSSRYLDRSQSKIAVLAVSHCG
jgi:glutamyl-tRNA reductase